MQQNEYKLLFDGNAATREQLDRVETVTVEQEIEMAWEARIEIPICADDKGNWSGEDEDFMRGFGRIRVEIRLDGGAFVPLIDGPTVGHDTKMDAQPGQSSITLVVHDDSVFLNRDEGTERFENMNDSQIALQVFDQYAEIADVRVEEVPAPPDSRPPEVMRRGTHMDLLRELARRNDMYAYVLPGPKPRTSIGVFAESSTEPDVLPDMVLTGKDRNLESFELRTNEQQAANVVASTMSLSDKGVITRTSSYRNIDLLGEEAVFQDASKIATRRLPPGQGEAVNLDHAVHAKARRLSYSHDASGSVLAECYRGVLEPGRLVIVRGVNGRNSGDYIISKVTHTLTRSAYTQSFELKRNARSAGSSKAEAIPGGIL